MNAIVVGTKKIAPTKIICIGRNYVEHIAELGNKIPDDMVVFLKPNSAISTKLISYQQEPIHYEAEICFLYENGAFSAVGFGLDLTKRTLQGSLKAKGLPWERAKSFDGSAIFSHFVEIPDIPSSLALELSIDHKPVQRGRVAQMIYKPDQILLELATFISLQDGDIVMTGTPMGVGIIQSDQIFTGTIRDQERVLVNGEWTAS